MKFKVFGQHPITGRLRPFFYETDTNTLSDGVTNQVYEDRSYAQSCVTKEFTNFSVDVPLKKSNTPRILKIQMGLSCNYSCEYCSQRFVEHADETNQHDVEGFIALLDNLDFQEGTLQKIEFWGGEPFVYIKTLYPLVATMRDKFKYWTRRPRMSIITNGSLLTKEINDWIVENDIAIAISHDGPGQSVRGPDPLEVPETKEAILDLYRRLITVGRISFNSMLNRENTSRAAIKRFFVELTGDANVPIGEGGLVDAYDEGGVGMSLTTLEDHFNYRKNAFNDIIEGEANNFGIVRQKVDGIFNDILKHTPSVSVTQKCGSDLDDVLTVDLKGDVLTCQNLSSVAVAPNGQSHKYGNITAIEEVEGRSSTHWSNREVCQKCPVVHVCQGSCMFLEGDLWNVSCENAYSDAVVMFSVAFHRITGMVPVYIEQDELPAHRKDIWGRQTEHDFTKQPHAKRRVIEIVNLKD